MRNIKRIFATLLVVCVLIANMQGFTVEATEAIEGGYVFEVKVSPKTELVAGAQFRMDVEITNTSDMDFDSLRFINAWYYEHEGASGIGIGILEDVNHKGVEIEQQAPINIAFPKGESKQFELGGSLPSSWNENSYIAIVVSGQVDNVNYYGQGGAPESAYPTWERAFEVSIDGPETAVSGEEIVLDVQVKNESERELTLTTFEAYCCQDDEEGSFIEETMFGTIYDSTGEITSDRITNITFTAGETKEFQLKGTLPESWNENCFIYITVESAIGNKRFTSSSGSFQTGKPGTGGDTDFQSKEGFEIVIQGPKNIVPGEEISLDVSVKNTSGKILTVNYTEFMYFENMSNWSQCVVEDFGSLLDEKGEDAYLNPENFVYKVNETKKYSVVGTVPDTWNNQSVICFLFSNLEETEEYYGVSWYCLHAGDKEIKGAVAATREQAGYTGDTYCLVCEQKIAEGKVIEKLVTEVKEEKIEGNLEASVKAEGNTTLPGNVIFVAEEVIKTIKAEEKAKIEKTIDSKALKEVTDKHKIATILDLKLILRDNNEEIKYEPDGAVQVTVQVPKSVLEGYENIVLLHIKDDGTIEVVPFELNSGDKATFKTDGFSYYVFVGTEKATDKSVQPATPNNDASTDNSVQTTQPVTQTPKTGDSSFTTLWLVMMLCALMGILVAIGKKNKFNR